MIRETNNITISYVFTLYCSQARNPIPKQLRKVVHANHKDHQISSIKQQSLINVNA